MKKVFSISIIFLIVICIFISQIYLINNKELFGIKPNLFLISVIVVSLYNNIRIGSFYSLLIGITTDILYGNTFGIFTLSYATVAIVIGVINISYIKQNKMSLILLTALGTVIFEITNLIIYLFLNINGFNLLYLISHLVISILLNIALSFVLYNVFKKVFDYLNEKNFDY